jgi:putative ABC transport system permease protein
MTGVAHPAALGGPRDGGVAARRAVIRWSRRMLRREWRQQLLVIALLIVAVAAAVGSITIVYHTSTPGNTEVGGANHLLKFDGGHPRQLEAGLAAARKWFGTTDVIEHRSIAVPGGFEKVDFRAQNPNGPYGSELLALRQGSYPVGPRQVAVTDGVAELLGLKLGATLALDGHRRTVVGIVENPQWLSDEFALVSPASAGPPEYDTVLVNASTDPIESGFGLPENNHALVEVTRPPRGQAAAALAMFSVATVFLLLSSLVATAGFAVVAQRRLRQLGMLSATGATQKHIRLVLLTNGALVGTIAALIGAIVGIALWLAVAPTVETGLDHRIDQFNLPLGLIIATVLLSVVGAAAAAWWPGRTAARLPVILALSGRPPKPRPARHAAIAAAVLIAAGIALLALSGRDRPPLIVAGLLATMLGTLLLGPLAIRAFSGLAGRVPIAPRLALRDLVRYQARSGAALAAVALALGIAAAVVIIASAEHAKKAAEPPNLSDRQLRVYMGPPVAREVIPAQSLNQVKRLGVQVAQLANRLNGAAVIPLRGAFQPGAEPIVIGDTRAYPPTDLMRRSSALRFEGAAQLFVATPAMLRYLGVDPATVDSRAEFLADPSVPTDRLVIPGLTSRRTFSVTNVQRIDTGSHLFGSADGMHRAAFITPTGLRRHGWTQIPTGWLVESSRPLTSDQIADARRLAADAGLTVEVREEASTFGSARAISIAAGALLALGILAMTVGLIRSESAGDLRILTATGATSRIRRTLTATTAGALALLGALLGVAGAYLVLIAIYHDDLGYLSHVPILDLAIAVVAVPVAAAGAGWLLAGREPPAIARTVTG